MKTTSTCPTCHIEITTKTKGEHSSTMNEHIREEHSWDYENVIKPQIEKMNRLARERSDIKRRIHEQYGWTTFGF